MSWASLPGHKPELGEQLLSLAQSTQDPSLVLEASLVLGGTLLTVGDFVSARDARLIRQPTAVRGELAVSIAGIRFQKRLRVDGATKQRESPMSAGSSR